MPRLKVDRPSKFTVSVIGNAQVLYGGLTGLADKIGCSKNILCEKVKNPSKFKVSELSKIRVALAIPKDEFSAMLESIV